MLERLAGVRTGQMGDGRGHCQACQTIAKVRSISMAPRHRWNIQAPGIEMAMISV